MAALETFTWSPRVDASGQESVRVRKAQFGDGYQQVSGDGLNGRMETWPVSFVEREALIRPIRDFLRRHQGFKAFLWTPPLGELGLYRCESWSVTGHGRGNYTLTATFEQTFHP